jgi:hypothetical protein
LHSQPAVGSVGHAGRQPSALFQYQARVDRVERLVTDLNS